MYIDYYADNRCIREAISNKKSEAFAAHQKEGTVNHAWKWGIGKTCALAGRRDEAQKILAELIEDVRLSDTMPLDRIYIILGEKDEAIRWQEAAYEYRNGRIPWISLVPIDEPLHDDSSIQDLLRRMNLQE